MENNQIERISVAMVYDSKSGKHSPYAVWWAGKRHLVTSVGYHHTYFAGRTLIHVFSVALDKTFLKLELNTATLVWYVKEVDVASF